MTRRALILAASFMGQEPSPRQMAVLRFVYNFNRDHGFAPALREIGKHFGIRSTNGVAELLLRLEGKGCIDRVEMQSRAMRITAHGYRWLDVTVPTGKEQLGIVELSDDVLTLQLSRPAMDLLTRLKETGLFGDNEADVAQRLLYEKLRELAMKGAANG